MKYIFESLDDISQMSAANNFLGKPQKRNVPYEGRKRRSDRAEKTRKALLKMHTAPAKNTILLLKSASLKMSRSEHSHS